MNMVQEMGLIKPGLGWSLAGLMLIWPGFRVCFRQVLRIL